MSMLHRDAHLGGHPCSPHREAEVARPDHVERLEALVRPVIADVTEAGVLSEGGQPTLLVEMLCGGHVDDGAGLGALHVNQHGSCNDPTEIDRGAHEVGAGRRSLIGQHLPDRVIEELGPVARHPGDRRGHVDGATGERGSDRRQQHAEGLARRALLCSSSCVHRRDLDGARPCAIVEARQLPSERMPTGIKGLEWEARHVTGKLHRRPRLTRAGLPRTIRDDPVVADLELEDHRSGAERVGRRHWGPP